MCISCHCDFWFTENKKCDCELYCKDLVFVLDECWSAGTYTQDSWGCYQETAHILLQCRSVRFSSLSFTKVFYVLWIRIRLCHFMAACWINSLRKKQVFSILSLFTRMTEVSQDQQQKDICQGNPLGLLPGYACPRKHFAYLETRKYSSKSP